MIFVYTTLDEVRHFGLDFLPSLPYTHADASSQPFIGFKEKASHVRKMIVPHPTSYVFTEFTLSLGISPTIAPTCQLFQSGLHLRFGFRMYRKLAFTLHYVKGVAKVFHTSHV